MERWRDGVVEWWSEARSLSAGAGGRSVIREAFATSAGKNPGQTGDWTLPSAVLKIQVGITLQAAFVLA